MSTDDRQNKYKILVRTFRSYQDSVHQRRVMNRHVRVALMSAPPFYYPTYDENGNARIIGSLEYLANAFFHLLNASYEVVNEDMTPGMELSPGNWTGAIGSVMSGEADIMFTAFIPTSDTAPYVGFSATYGAAYSTVLSGPPAKVFEASIPLTKTLTPKTWATVVFSWITISLISSLLTKIENNIPKNGKSLKGNIKLGTVLQNNLLGFYGILFQRGFDHFPGNVGRRIIMVGWLLLSVILMTDVASNFASLLSVNKLPERIESVSDILKYPKLFPYIMKGWTEHQLLSRSDDEELQALWQLVVENDALIDISDLGDPRIMDDVNAGKAVFLSYRGSLIEMLVGIVCSEEGGREKEFYIAKKNFEFLPFAHFYRRGLDNGTIEALNKAAVWPNEHGFVERVLRELQRPAEPCLKKTIPRIFHRRQRLEGLKQVLQFYGIGNCVAMIVFVLESLLSKKSQK